MFKPMLSKQKKFWRTITCLWVFMLSFYSTMAFAQGFTVTGVVTDETDEPLPGVNVFIKGTTMGIMTDVDGKFTLNQVQAQSVIVFSYIGFLPQEFTVGSQRTFNVRMREDVQSLDEVVVVGYGVLKKKLVTGATIQVSGESIQKMSTTNPLTALQSKSPGVTILQNNGQPGAGYIVNIRGIGTNGESRPFYIVDGMPAGNDALNQMSPADIESIDILKDAASAAIYGAQGANGIVLITTKQGKSGKPKLTYDGYYGQQYMAKKPDLLNAREYMMMQDEVRFNENSSPYNWESLLPADLYRNVMNGTWNGSDWVDAFYNKGAAQQGHAFNLIGGNENSKFSIGYSYTSQDGLFGEAVQGNYTRNTFRINSDHVLLKAKGMDVIKIGETLNYNYHTDHGISTGNIYWNAFHNVLVANPLMPVYNENGGYYDYYDKRDNGWGFDGNMTNPIAAVAYSSQGLNLNKNHSLRANAFLEIQPVKGLLFRSQFGYNTSANSYRNQNQKARLSNNFNVTAETISQSQSVGNSWTLENTLTYNLLLDGHNVNFLLGQSAEKWGFGEDVGSGGNNNIFDLGWDYAWVSNTVPTQLSERSASGSPWGQGARAGYFGRVQYNYKETYMATASLRVDGSSNFARGNRWGYFPSFSAGWVITNESFMQGVTTVMDFLKLRASWGQNGNSSVGGFQYLSRYQFRDQDSYFFGTDKVTPSTGAVAGVLKNPDITWETQQQTDIGFDARFLNQRLGVVFDWFNRETKDWLLQAPISATWGFSAPNVNGGVMSNKGVELSFTWDDRVGDFTYSLNVNGSYIKNEVVSIANAEGIINGTSNVLSQGTGTFTRLQEGYPSGFFFGWQADGIFQNQAEVDAYKNSKGELIIPAARPGDVRFVDINGDGVIDDDDRTMIGCGWPIYRGGFSINLGYKGFDFSIDAAGAFDFDIAKSYRSFADSPNQNYTTQVFERWTGEGTSNKWPRLVSGSHPNYQRVSNIFLEKGDYVKIQNITLGYDLKRLYRPMPLEQLRIYVTAQNLFTFTKYSGMDPEIGFGDSQSWASGIDLGFYPAARTYLFGIKATF